MSVMSDDLHTGAHRLIPPLTAPANTAQQSLLQDDAAPVQVHAGADTEPTEYTVSVDETRARLHALGIAKSKDTIQRYCREGDLDCQKLGMLRRYFATEASVNALIAKLQNDATASAGVKVHAPAPEETTSEDQELHEGARSRTQIDAPVDDESIVDFLKEQVRVKDEQIKVKDEQIVSMLERDRETNILIKGLQTSLTNTVGLLTGKREDYPNNDGVRDAEHAHHTDIGKGSVENEHEQART